MKAKNIFSSVIAAAVMTLSVPAAPFIRNFEVSALNDTYQTAKAIGLNQSVSDSLIDYNDSKWYSFNVTDAGYITFDFEKDYLEGNDDDCFWKFYIYKTDSPGSNSLYYKEFNHSDLKETTACLGLRPGKYFIEITRGYDFSDQDYKLTLNFTKSNEWEQENNDTYKEANSLELNSSVNACISEYNDSDYYSFEINKDDPGYLTFDFEKEYLEGNDNNSFWKMYVYRSDSPTSNEVFYREFNHSDLKETTCPLGLKPGKYFIEITRGYDHTDDNYKLTLNFTKDNAWEQEENDTYKDADEVKPNSSISGSIDDYNESDYYSFSIDDPGYVSFDFEKDYLEGNNDNSFWRMYVYNSNSPSSNELFYREFNHSDIKESTACLGLSAGKYFVEITRGYDYSEQPYTMKLNYVKTDDWEEQPNETYKEAKVITVNSSINGALTDYNDDDYYKFELKNTSKISLDFEKPCLDDDSSFWSVGIYTSTSPTSSDIQTYEFNGVDKIESTKSIELSAGTYFIRVNRGYDHSDVSYKLTLKDENYSGNEQPAGEDTLGDVNGDNIINAVDASRVLVFYAALNAGEVEVTEKDITVCDINKDKMINAVDASLILAFYANLNADPSLTLEVFLADKIKN